MHFSTVAVLLSAAASAAASSLAARQSSPYPDCANSCIANANLGSCTSATDLLCLCTSSAFISSTTTCIEAACSGSDLQTALSVSQAICASVGVTLTSTPASSTTSAASSVTSAPASTTVSTSPTSTAPATTTSTTTTTSGAGSTRAVSGLLALGAAGIFALAL